MKTLKFAILFCTILLTGNVFAQQKTDMPGMWTAVVINIVDQIYVDIDKDSVKLSDKMWEEMDKENAMDSTAKAATIAALKTSLTSAFSKMFFLIDEKGGIFEGDKNEKVGQYDAAKNTITYTDLKTKEQKTEPVEIKNGLLKLMIFDEGENIVVWCRKEK